MKIVTWNCNGAFRKKYQEIAKLDADIYVIQECENPERIKGAYENWASKYIWYGENNHKGLGVFAKNNVEIHHLKWQDNGLQIFLPVRVNENFNLIAVWTKQNNISKIRYIEQLWEYLKLYKEKMTTGPTILCGDFNSNKIWDFKHPMGSHSDVVTVLTDANMHSIYHLATGEKQGEELTPTFFMNRMTEKSYHIDFAFTTEGMFNPVSNTVVIGNHNQWLVFSDHVPVTFTITLPRDTA